MKKDKRNWDRLVNPIGTPTIIGDREHQVYEGITAISSAVQGYVIKVTKAGQTIGYIPPKEEGAAETAKELMDLIDTMKQSNSGTS